MSFRWFGAGAIEGVVIVTYPFANKTVFNQLRHSRRKRETIMHSLTYDEIRKFIKKQVKLSQNHKTLKCLQIKFPSARARAQTKLTLRK